MDRDLLRTFLAVCERQSFRAAAHDVHRTQSAVSQQIKRLEGEVGVQLLERSTKSVELTPAGTRLYDYASRLLTLQEEAMAATRGASEGQRLRVGLTDDVAAYALVPALGAIEAADRSAVLDIETRTTQTLIAGIGSRYDIAIVVVPQGSRLGEKIADIPLVWLGSDEVAARATLELAVYGDRCVMREAALAALDRAKVKWTTKATVSGLLVIEAVVRAGLAVAPALAGLHAPDLPRVSRLPVLPEMELRVIAEGMWAERYLPVIRDELRAMLAA